MKAGISPAIKGAGSCPALAPGKDEAVSNPQSVEEIARGLSKAQRAELRLVQDGDCGCLARGDLAGLTRARLATAPMGQGYYRLTPLGEALRNYLKGSSNV